MRDIPTSPRVIEIKHKKHMRTLRWVIFSVVLFGLIVWGLSYLSNDKHVVIDKIEITGAHIISQEGIEKEVKNNLSGEYIHLFSKSNIFIYPRNKIYNNLLLNFPRIESLSVYRDNLRTLHINISERTGSYLYCGVTIPENKEEIGENCYFINDNGYIFDEAPYFSGNIYFKYYVSLEDNSTSPLGKQMVQADEFRRMMRFIDGVNSIGLKSIYMHIDSDGTNYLYLNHSINNSIPRIIFKNDSDFEAILENLTAAMKKKEFADEVKSKYNTLQYIDLRFKNKVLYKF